MLLRYIDEETMNINDNFRLAFLNMRTSYENEMVTLEYVVLFS